MSITLNIAIPAEMVQKLWSRDLFKSLGQSPEQLNDDIETMMEIFQYVDSAVQKLPDDVVPKTQSALPEQQSGQSLEPAEQLLEQRSGQSLEPAEQGAKRVHVAGFSVRERYVLEVLLVDTRNKVALRHAQRDQELEEAVEQGNQETSSSDVGEGEADDASDGYEKISANE